MSARLACPACGGNLLVIKRGSVYRCSQSGACGRTWKRDELQRLLKAARTVQEFFNV